MTRRKPRGLDLCAGQGGMARGLIAAGAEVDGVDSHAAHGRYYPGNFIHGDALEYLAAHGHEYDFLAAGYPCQRWTAGLRSRPDIAVKYPAMIGAGRALMLETGLPYVIENVTGAAAELRDPVLLCGRMFGLEATDTDGTRLILDRHRLIESNIALLVPEHPEHDEPAGSHVAGVYGGARRASRPRIGCDPAPWQDRHAARKVRRGGYVPRSPEVRAALLGIDPGTMTGRGMELCIPPAFGEFLGHALIAAARERIAA